MVIGLTACTSGRFCRFITQNDKRYHSL